MDASLESALLLFMADLQPVFDEQDAAIHDEQLELRANLEETAVPLEESGFELSVPLGHLPQSTCCGRRIRDAAACLAGSDQIANKSTDRPKGETLCWLGCVI
jgi:hypothetical protein